jgi:hypothetical protein
MVIGLILIFVIGGMLGFLIGFVKGYDDMKIEAISEGAASWNSDQRGRPRFKWKRYHND